MMTGSMAGNTNSDGKQLTEGLEYSSSAIDVASHNNIQQISELNSAHKSVEPAEIIRQASAAEQEEKIQSQLNEFKFQNSPVGTFGGIPDSDFHANHETSQQQLIMSGGTSSHYLNQSNLSGSEEPIYKKVSLKLSNKFGVTSDSQKQIARKEHNHVQEP